MHGSRRLRFAGTIAAASVLTLTSVSAASATSLVAPAPQPKKVSGGTSTITPSAAVKRTGLKVTSAGESKASGSAIAVPLTTGVLGLPGKASVLDHGAKSGLTLTGPSGSVTVTDLQIKAGKNALVRASIDGGKPQLLFQLKITKLFEYPDGAAGRSNASLRLTAGAAKAVRSATGATTLRSGRFGTLTVATKVVVPPAPTAPAPNVTTPTPAPTPVPEPKPTPTPDTIAASSLAWTQRNMFEGSSAPGSPTLNRTWLGYFTNPTPFSGNNGSYTPSDGAEGPTVTPTSLRGIAADPYRVSFPATSSTASAAAKTGVVRFEGLVTFASAAPPAGHGITIAIEDPRIEFDGTDTAKLYANGLRTGGTQQAPVIEPYGDDNAVFTLALGSDAPTDNGDGTVTYDDVVPAIAATGHVFPGNYGVGAGPDRTPNTFGSFSIRLPKVAPAS